MKRRAFSARDLRALRLGALLALPGVLYAGAVRPYVAHVESQREVIARESDLLQRELSLLRGATTFEQRLAYAESRMEAHRTVGFEGPDPVTTTALLIAYVSQMAQENDVRIDRTEGGAPDTAGFERRLSVRVTATSDVSGLMSWLDELETGPRAVRVERMSVRTRASGARFDLPAASPEELEVVVDLVAFRTVGSAEREAET